MDYKDSSFFLVKVSQIARTGVEGKRRCTKQIVWVWLSSPDMWSDAFLPLLRHSHRRGRWKLKNDKKEINEVLLPALPSVILFAVVAFVSGPPFPTIPVVRRGSQRYQVR